VAFHLHSFGLRSTALSTVLGISKPHLFADYVHGRIALTERDAADFARFVQVPPDELLRPLSDDEAFAWRFYRISAAHHVTIWHRARDTWQLHGMSLSGAARVMGFSPTHACLALQPGSRRRILPLPPATRLADACAIDVRTFIAELDDPNPNQRQTYHATSPPKSRRMDHQSQPLAITNLVASWSLGICSGVGRVG
jgi:hypothetical protein